MLNEKFIPEDQADDAGEREPSSGRAGKNKAETSIQAEAELYLSNYRGLTPGADPRCRPIYFIAYKLILHAIAYI
jgi:hypothetical protein